MLTIIPVLTFLIFGALYPLSFWLSHQGPISKDFHKFHIGLPNCIAGLGVVILLFMEVPLWIKIFALGWKAIFLSVSYFYWKKPDINRMAITIVSLLGIAVIGVFQLYVIQMDIVWLPIIIIGGLVFCSVFYAMNLGHHYLNVPGLPIEHLTRATKVFWVLLMIRLVWDIYYLMTGEIIVNGEPARLYQFLGHLDGFFLVIALFFGTLLPLGLVYFVLGTLKVKSTQSATGILYVMVVSVLMGDLTYKYYLVKFGLAL